MAASRATRSRPNCCRRSANFRLPVEPLSRLIEEHQFDLYNDPMPSMAALEGYVTDTSSALFSLAARVIGAAVGGDRPPRAPCRARPGHGAGDRRAAARCRAAAAVPAAAVAAAARQRDGRRIFGQADAATARRDRPARSARRASHLADRALAAADGAAAGAAGLPAAGAGPAAIWRACRVPARRSLVPQATSRAAGAVDAVEGVAATGVRRVGLGFAPVSTPERGGRDGVSGAEGEGGDRGYGGAAAGRRGGRGCRGARG